MPRSHSWSLLVSAILIFGLSGPSGAHASAIPGTPVQPYVSERGSDYLVVVWAEPNRDAEVISNYELRYSGDAGATWVTLNHADTTSLSHNIGDLSSGVNYVVEIRSNGVSGSSEWVRVLSKSAVIQIDTGDIDGFACGLVIDGRVKCWGIHNFFVGGAGNRLAKEVPGLSQATQVTSAEMVIEPNAGAPYSCALLADQTLWCWGYNQFGQLGDGTTTSRTEPVQVLGVSTVVQVSAGGGRTCVLLADGSVKCWGINLWTCMGGCNTAATLVPSEVSGIHNAVQISTGTHHACALIADGSIQCWGDNWNGQLGDGTMISKSYPVEVLGISNAVQVTSGGSNTCALLSDGNVKCWGGPEYKSMNLIPTLVPGISTARQVSSGLTNACALLVDGAVQCWDYNQLTPAVVQGIFSPVDISAGSFANSTGSVCAALVDGTVKCQGHSAPVVITADPPGEPNSLSASSRASNALNLKWSAPDADGLTVDKYKVEWSINGTSWIANEVTSANATLTGLTSGTAYHVRVSAHSAAGWGAASTSTFSTLPVLAYATGAKVLGVASVGKSLKVANGTWTAAPKATFTYQWYSCTKASKTVSTVGKVAAGCKPISRATASTLKLTTAHKKLYMAALITAKNTAGTKKVFTATVGPDK